MTSPEQLAQRIRSVRRELCNDSNTDFAQQIGKSRQHASALCNGSSPAGRHSLELILRAFPNVRREWLYFGTGQMTAELPASNATTAELYADIADTFAHLAAQFNRLSLCNK